MRAFQPTTQAYLIHDRDRIFARRLDNSIKNLGMTVLKLSPHSTKPNVICDRNDPTRVLGLVDSVSESHLR